LQSIPELTDTRLVGGTALAFHLGHRLSIDLDLFGSFDHEILTETLKSATFHSFYVLSESKVIKQYLINQVKVDIVKYDRYQWLEEAVIENQIRIAGLKDIAAMKVAAITNRGSKKDFIDLFFLLKTFNLQKIIELYQTKYPDANLFPAIRSLAYFDDAEREKIPKMLIPTDWETVKKKITTEVKKI
jgi:predicted nucleotidyltransferase component of viral defense system